MTEIDQLDDKKLIEMACELGVKTCPITPQTRKIIIKRIENALKNQNPSADLSNDSPNHFNDFKSDSGPHCLPIPTLSSAVGQQIDNSISNEMLDCLSHNISQMNLQSTPNRPVLASSSGQYFVVQSLQNSMIVNSLKEVTEMAKVDPELRFKTFSTYNEAESSRLSFMEEISKIQSSGLDTSQLSHVMNGSGNGQLAPFTTWRSIPTKLLVKYRKHIENGDIKNVLLCCLNNPRYVISSIDTPVILHEGTRRNAFHIAAEKNQPQVISLLLQLMRNDMWSQACHLIPNKDDDTIDNILKNNHYKDYISHTLDHYLNSPDKILFETPLHIASKFGAKDVVELLIAQPEINKYPKNKYGETPYDLIGSRCGADDYESILEDVKNLFNNL